MQHEIALSGHGLCAVPLSPQHASALFDFVDPQMWAGMAAARPLDAADLAALFRARLDDPSVIPFAVTDQRTGALLGTTSLCDYVPSQQRIEIGGTFFGRQFWGSHVNAASKNMLLGYAFDVLGVHRVAFRCDATNRRSAAAIERLGAQFEGVLRAHRTAPDGGRSNTAVFSILAEEWPRVRDGLGARLAPFAVTDSYAVRSFAAL
ncbi:MAG: GNAT family protein [Arthrobacter sp.]|nr:GNAT family protein [Arthrobacter sp.]